MKNKEDIAMDRFLEAALDEARQDEECVRIMTGFIAEKPDLWNEDIGV